MANMVRIEIQNQHGEWKSFTKVANNPASIKLSLQRAVNTQMAQKSKKARAVDDKTGALLDIHHG